MKITHYSDAGTLYIDLAEKPGTDAKEIVEGIVLHLDVADLPVSIEIEQASRRVDLSRFVAGSLLVSDRLHATASLQDA